MTAGEWFDEPPEVSGETLTITITQADLNRERRMTHEEAFYAGIWW